MTCPICLLPVEPHSSAAECLDALGAERRRRTAYVEEYMNEFMGKEVELYEEEMYAANGEMSGL